MNEYRSHTGIETAGSKYTGSMISSEVNKPTTDTHTHTQRGRVKERERETDVQREHVKAVTFTPSVGLAVYNVQTFPTRLLLSSTRTNQAQTIHS